MSLLPLASAPRHATPPRHAHDPFSTVAHAALSHLAHLRGIAERILGCPDQAADAAQEVLVTLWRTAEMPHNLRAWLTRTVIHRALHARRGAERRRKWEDLAAVEWSRDCALCNPEHEAEGRELGRRLDAALRALSAEHLRILELRAIEGFEYDDIARRLGVPVGTVRSRLNRARIALRGELERTA